MFKKQGLLILISILLLTFILAAQFMGERSPYMPQKNEEQHSILTTSQNDSLQDSDLARSLKMVVYMNPAEFFDLQSLKMEFENKYPGTTIQLENVSKTNAYNVMRAAAEIGEAPDVMMLDNEWLNEFAMKGYLSSRTDEFFPGELQSRQNEEIMSQVKWNGYTWGVPQQLDTYVLVWNPHRFGEKELDHPPASADELVAMHWKLTEPEAQKVGLYFAPDDPYALISFIGSMGGSWLEGKGEQQVKAPQDISKLLDRLVYEPGEANRQNSEEGLEETPTAGGPRNEQMDLAWLMGNDNVRNSDAWTLLQQGDIAMMIVRASEFLNHAHTDLEVSPLPASSVGEMAGAWMDGVSLAVSVNSNTQERAFQWIQMLSSSEVQLKMMKAGGGLPVNMEAYRAIGASTLPYLRQVALAVEQGKALPLGLDSARKFGLLKEEMQKLFSGASTVKQFSEGLSESWQEDES